MLQILWEVLSNQSALLTTLELYRLENWLGTTLEL